MLTTVEGFDVYVQKDASGEISMLAVTEGGDPESEMAPQGICTHIVAGGVFALGAAVIGAAALTGGIVVAGVFLSPYVLGMLSAAMGSYSAVQGIIAAYVC